MPRWQRGRVSNVRRKDQSKQGARGFCALRSLDIYYGAIAVYPYPLKPPFD
jgi:hypothetical protein